MLEKDLTLVIQATMYKGQKSKGNWVSSELKEVIVVDEGAKIEVQNDGIIVRKGSQSMTKEYLYPCNQDTVFTGDFSHLLLQVHDRQSGTLLAFAMHEMSFGTYECKLRYPPLFSSKTISPMTLNFSLVRKYPEFV